MISIYGRMAKLRDIQSSVNPLLGLGLALMTNRSIRTQVYRSISAVRGPVYAELHQMKQRRQL